MLNLFPPLFKKNYTERIVRFITFLGSTRRGTIRLSIFYDKAPEDQEQRYPVICREVSTLEANERILNRTSMYKNVQRRI